MRFINVASLTLFLCLLFDLSAMAQTIQLKGKVTDSTGAPLVGAVVALFDTSGRRMRSVVSATDGRFTISVDRKRDSHFIISYTEFGSRTLFIVKDKPDLGDIVLVPASYSLTEVVVKRRKPPVSFKVDRQVFSAAQFNSAANGNAIDVIRNLPSVSVNGQGEISVRGSSSFQVMINGRPAVGDPAAILSQLSAGSIEQVEVISTPGAAYDADGKSGVINIVTKASTEGGWMIQSGVMYGAPPVQDFDNERYKCPQRHSIDVSAGFRKRRLDFSAGFNYLRNDMAGYREGDVYTLMNDVKTSFPSEGERSFKRYNFGGRVALGYQTESGDRWDAGAYFGKRFQSRVADLVYRNSRSTLSGTPISSFDYFNENTQDKEGLFSLAYLGYEHRLGESTRIKLNAQYEGAGLEGLTTNRNLSLPDRQTVYQETLNPSTNPLQSVRLKGDFIKKTSNGEWQAGYQIRRDVQDGDFRYYNRDLGDSGFTLDPRFTSQVRLDNTIHAVYVQHNSRKGRLSLQEGLRFEHQHRVLDFSQNGDRRVLKLPSLFPSLTMRYELAVQSYLKAGYTRRVKRTNNYELNPFPEREHAETLEQGDPELLPELTATWEAGWERSWKTGTLSVSVYRQSVKNPIQRVNKVFNDTILNRVYTNAGRATQIGLEANLNARIAPWWQTVLGGNVYRYRIEGEIFNGTVPVDNASWVYSINAVQTFQFSASTTLQLTVNYLSERATAQGEDGAFFTPHLSLKHVGKSKRWTWQFQWQNMDLGMQRSNRQRITTYGLDFFTTTHYVYEPDQLQVSMTFNLNRKNRKIDLPVSEMAEKEF